MKFIIYGKPECKYCRMAVNLVKATETPYEYIDISEDTAAKEFIVSNGFTTVPQVYSKKDDVTKHIGGYSELYEYFVDWGNV